MEIVGFGALNLDHFYEVNDLSVIRDAGFDLHPGGEISGTPEEAQCLQEILMSEGRLLARSGGGSAANTMCILAALGHDTAFIGTVGDDEAGHFILSTMNDVDCSRVRTEGRSSQCIVIIEDSTRDRAMFVVPGDGPAELSHDLDISEARMLHMSSLALEQGPAIQESLISLLGRNQILSFDPGELYAARGMKELCPLFVRTDLLFITFQELKMLDSKHAGHDVYRAMRQDRGAPVMVIKQGRYGASVFIRGQEWSQAAVHAVEVVDNTGAGDAFDAGYIHKLLQNSPVTECLQEAVEVAALSLQDYGRNWLSML